MFPNIDNKSGLLSVKEALTDSNFDVDSTQCIADALEICLICNNSEFNHQHFLQTDVTTQSPYMSCSCADIALAKYDSLAKLISSILSLLFEKDLEMMFLYYGNMVPLFSLLF